MKPEEIRDNRQMRSLTGLSLKQFSQLSIEFEKGYQEDQRKRYTAGLAKDTRQRRLGGGRNGKLPRIVDKLFFTLAYFKTCSTFGVLGTQFGMGHSKANENLHKLVPILMNTLVRLEVMSHCEFASVDAMKVAFQGVDRILIDVTERLYRRLQDDDIQKSTTPSKIP